MGVDAKKILYDIVNRHGADISTDLGKLKAILRDCHVDKLRVNLLIEIAKASYFRTFLTKINASNIEIEKKMLAESVRDDYDFEEDYVHWGVECWAQAVFRSNVWANKQKIARYVTEAPEHIRAYEATVKVTLSHTEQIPSNDVIYERTEPAPKEKNEQTADSQIYMPTAEVPLTKIDTEEKELFAKVASLTFQGVMEEQEKIRKTLKRAEDGDANYRFLLAEMYERGNGVNPNFRKALKWYKLSALQGNVKAMFRLGQIYEQGKLIPVNYEEALRWYKAAKDKGDEYAVNRYKQIKRRLKGLL